MRLTRTAVYLSAALGLTVGLSGQSRDPLVPLRPSEPQHIHGHIQVASSAAGQTQIKFCLNTPTYLAKEVVLEAANFTMLQDGKGAVLIESAGPVRVSGFTLAQDLNDLPVLRDSPGYVSTWDRGFKLRILADGTPEWGCCPRKE